MLSLFQCATLLSDNYGKETIKLRLALLVFWQIIRHNMEVCHATLILITLLCTLVHYNNFVVSQLWQQKQTFMSILHSCAMVFFTCIMILISFKWKGVSFLCYDCIWFENLTYVWLQTQSFDSYFILNSRFTMSPGIIIHTYIWR